MHFSVTFELTGRAPGLDIGFYVKDEDGTWLLNEAWSDERGAMPTEQLGTYRATMMVPPVLSAGRYILALWMGSPYETLIDEDVLTFDLEPRLDDRVEATRRPRIVQPNVAWDLGRGRADDPCP